MKERKIIATLLLLLLAQCLRCLNHDDFCNYDPIEGKELKCQGKYKLRCGRILCAKNGYSCQNMRLFSSVNNRRNKNKNKNKFESFMKQIKDCPESALLNQKWNSKYKWNF